MDQVSGRDNFYGVTLLAGRCDWAPLTRAAGARGRLLEHFQSRAFCVPEELSKPFATNLMLWNGWLILTIETARRIVPDLKLLTSNISNEVFLVCHHRDGHDQLNVNLIILVALDIMPVVEFDRTVQWPGGKFVGSTRNVPRLCHGLRRFGSRAAYRTSRVLRHFGGGRCGSGTIANSTPATSETTTANCEQKRARIGNIFA